MSETVKRCRDCFIEQTPKNSWKSRRGGLNTYCKKCDNERRKIAKKQQRLSLSHKTKRGQMLYWREWSNKWIEVPAETVERFGGLAAAAARRSGHPWLADDCAAHARVEIMQGRVSAATYRAAKRIAMALIWHEWGVPGSVQNTFKSMIVQLKEEWNASLDREFYGRNKKHLCD